MHLPDNHESKRIDIVDQGIDGRQLTLLDDAQHRLLLRPLKSRFDIHQRQTDVLHIQQRFFDFLKFFGNDEKLHLICSGDHDFVYDDGRQEHHDEPVKDLFHAGKERLDQQKDDIERVHPDRNRNAEMLVQEQRRNIHPPCGSADLEHQTHTQSAQDPSVDCRKQDIVSHILQSRYCSEKSQKSRENDCAQYRRQGELPSQQRGSDEKHETIENQHDQRNV